MSGAGFDRFLRSLEVIVRALLADPVKVTGLRFFGRYRYRIQLAWAGPAYDLQAVDSALGLPDLERVVAWPSLAGSLHTPALGSVVVVSFLDGSPASPVIDAYEDPSGAGWRPRYTRIDVTGGGAAVVVGDDANPIKAVALDGDTGDGPWLQVIAGTLTSVAPATPGAIHVTTTITGTAKKLKAEKA